MCINELIQCILIRGILICRSDLPANELVQRHKISSRGSSSSITSMSSVTGGMHSPGYPSVFGNGQGTMSSHQNLTSTVSSSTNSSNSGNLKCRQLSGGFLSNSARSSPNIAAASSPQRQHLAINISAAMASPQHVLVRRSLSTNVGGVAGPASAGANLTASVASPFGFGFDDGKRSVPSQAREYVESLHQNQWDSLLYGMRHSPILIY